MLLCFWKSFRFSQHVPHQAPYQTHSKTSHSTSRQLCVIALLSLFYTRTHWGSEKFNHWQKSQSMWEAGFELQSSDFRVRALSITVCSKFIFFCIMFLLLSFKFKQYPTKLSFLKQIWEKENINIKNRR